MCIYIYVYIYTYGYTRMLKNGWFFKQFDQIDSKIYGLFASPTLLNLNRKSTAHWEVNHW